MSGRRSKWGVLVVWLVLVAALAPLGSKLSNKTDNRTESWWPSSPRGGRRGLKERPPEAELEPPSGGEPAPESA